MLFHPAVCRWFEKSFAAPTSAQQAAWPAIKGGTHTLIAAPTGSGKTLAAFLCAIDDLVREDQARGLRDEVYVLYVSPLKALSNDIHKNLDQPLLGIADALFEHGIRNPGIRAMVRTGDTTQAERNRMRREPPHILVTTPESLFILLTSDSGRRMLRTVRSVIVDEIHALAPNKRGSHLALSLERLDALCDSAPVRIGLSATQRPLATIARFLVGNRDETCTIVDSGHVRNRDIAIEIPASPLEAVMATEVWQEVYDRLTALIEQHKTTLIFVNTRRLAERAARFLAERLGEEHVTAHHGSLAREHRLNAEQRLKHGKLKALVATASLELGIDIGDVDLVCQLGSPRSIAAFLQRVGRSGHSVGGTPKGRLFPLTRDDLVECAALMDAVRRDELDVLTVPPGHLDVLAQQLIAEVANGDWQEDALYRQMIKAWPYRELTRQQFTDMIRMLAEGFTTRRGRRSRYVHYDAVNSIIKPRPNARLTAVTNGGAIPDQFDYEVVLEPESYFIGTVNEDFAFESLPGDIFQLGNTSYRILKVEQGKVRVEDAHGQPPNIPFWIGEAPGRSDELSLAVSRLRAELDALLDHGMEVALQWLLRELQLERNCAEQLAEYLAATKAALGCIPTQQQIVFERFFDEAGDQHLVIHSPYGARVNRAWGLGLRKRFCRQFNFELQAAALEDSIVISLGPTHSFPLEDATLYVNSGNIRHNVTQAMLAVPMFPTHWRWNASIALAIKRSNNGKRVPAQFQRTDAEDLMAVVFPDQLACQDNLTGEREIPDHPLVAQTIYDCLHGVMDITGLESLLKNHEDGNLTILCRDLSGPSPMAQEILTARPYAFLDDAPAEERRTQAVNARRYMDPQEAAELAQLNPEAIARVCVEAWPAVANADELHDALMVLGFMTSAEGQGGNPQGTDYRPYLDQLIMVNRATLLTAGTRSFWVCAERLPLLQALFPDAVMTPPIQAAGAASEKSWHQDEALVELLRARLEGLGPVTASQLIDVLACQATAIQAALLWLQNEGYAMQGQFTQRTPDTEWCERGLLARMHRYTIKNLRAEIQVVSAAGMMRFLLRWHHMDIPQEGEAALEASIEQLEGFPIAAAAWERDILPARIRGYLSLDLDRLCSTGRVLWLRLNRDRVRNNGRGHTKSALLRNTPIALLERHSQDIWRQLQSATTPQDKLSAAGNRVMELLQQHGASFFMDIITHTGLLRTQVEEALAELAACGLVTSDSYAGLRALITPPSKRPGFGRQHRQYRRVANTAGIDAAGRWSLVMPIAASEPQNGWIKTDPEVLNHIAYALLKRYGVVFRRLLEREDGLPPWRELLYAYRRMEARGEIRGGRFVGGFSGEQFALSDAVGLLRNQRNRAQPLPDIIISATDPLNLLGILLPGERIAALHTNRILFRDGAPVAVQLNGEVRYLQETGSQDQWEVRQQFSRRYNPAGFAQPIGGYTRGRTKISH
jgi:ATP-dependent Lhr-like helicase